MRRRVPTRAKLCVGLVAVLLPPAVAWPFAAIGFRTYVENFHDRNDDDIALVKVPGHGPEAVAAARKAREDRRRGRSRVSAAWTETPRGAAVCSWWWHTGGVPVWAVIFAELAVVGGVGRWLTVGTGSGTPDRRRTPESSNPLAHARGSPASVVSSIAGRDSGD